MNINWRYQCWWLGIFCLVIGGTLAEYGGSATAEITPDATLGSEGSVVNSNVVINGLPSDRIDGGAIRGKNLFHSFVQFSVEVGRGAYFTNPAGIENILSRVTGSNRSEIFGKLGVLGQANLFLINPHGIIFGPEASLDVNGSFVATTADAIQFSNQGFFSASAPAVPPLLTVNPSALLFNQIAPKAIASQSVAPAGLDPTGNSTFGLRVPDSQSLLLVGGNINIDSSTGNNGGLKAFGGRIELAGLAVPGTVGLNIAGNNFSLSFPNDIRKADVSLTNGSEVNVRAGGNGSITINTENLNITGGSKLRAGIASNLGSPDSKAGDIDINATGVIKLTDGSFIANVVQNGAIGRDGNINIQAESVFATDGSNLIASTLGKGDAGNINIYARDIVSFDGESQDIPGFLYGGAYSQVKSSGAEGRGGSVNITTGSLFVTNGAVLTAVTNGKGDAGDINIYARDTVSFAGEGSFDQKSSGAYTNVNGTSLGQGGSINITTGSLSVTDGAQLVASTFGQRDAGNINIYARDTISFAKQGPDLSSSGAFSRVESGATGKGGSINITTGSLSVTAGAVLTTSTNGQGDAGNVNISARDTVSFIGEGSFDPELGFRQYSGAFSSVKGNGIGRGGNVNITTTGSLSLTQGAEFNTSTFGHGDAGNVTIQVNGPISFNGKGSGPNFFSSGAFSEVDATNTTVSKGGDIKIRGTSSLSVTNGAQLSTSSGGRGNAGNIFVDVNSTLEAINGTISTSAVQSTGGAINVTSRDIRLSRNSGIKTNVFSGAGNGGNITLTARSSIIAFDNSDIFAFARDGKGGNITLDTPAFFGFGYRPTPRGTDPATLDRKGRMDINASGAVAGIITLPDNRFVQSSLTQLPTNIINTNNLIAHSCITRSLKQKGSFLITGVGGLPTRPDDLSTAPFQTYTVPTVTVSSHLSRSVSSTAPAPPWKLGDTIVEPQGLYRLPNGQLILSRDCSQ